MKIPKRIIVVSAVSVAVLLLSIAGWLLVRGAYIPVLNPSGEVAQQQYLLIVFTVMLSLLVVVPVFTMLAVFAYKYRSSNNSAKYAPNWDSNVKLEAVWWGIPILIIAVLSVVTYITSHSLDPYRPIESSKKPVEVKVLAVQWKWIFFYPEQRVATVDKLVLPAGRPVHFSLSADAPMSSFWIPALGSQIYNMNGMTSQLNLIANETGTYRGYSTNINGKGYASMTFDTMVVEQHEFDNWHLQLARQGSVMNMDTYNTLAEPSVLDGTREYSMPNDEVYDAVVAKYMSHGGHGGHMMHDHSGHKDMGDDSEHNHATDDNSSNGDHHHMHHHQEMHENTDKQHDAHMHHKMEEK